MIRYWDGEGKYPSEQLSKLRRVTKYLERHFLEPYGRCYIAIAKCHRSRYGKTPETVIFRSTVLHDLSKIPEVLIDATIA